MYVRFMRKSVMILCPDKHYVEEDKKVVGFHLYWVVKIKGVKDVAELFRINDREEVVNILLYQKNVIRSSFGILANSWVRQFPMLKPSIWL